MNSAASMLTWLRVLAAIATVARSAAEQPLSITLAAPSKPVMAGAGLVLLATIKNTSTHDEHFLEPLGEIPEDWFRYKITALGLGGRPAPPSPRVLKARRTARKGNPPAPIEFGFGTSRTLKPGQSFEDRIDVTKDYDLSRPGIYSIWVTRPIPLRMTPQGVVTPKGHVRSNTIVVTVVK